MLTGTLILFVNSVLLTAGGTLLSLLNLQHANDLRFR
jgi:hypothetical protein